MIEKRCLVCREVLYQRETFGVESKSERLYKSVITIYTLYECLNCKEYFHKKEKVVVSEELI